MYVVVSFVDTRYFLAQGFHSRDSIQLTSIFLLFINILLVKTSFLRAAVGTLITRIPCIFNIETKPICSEQCPTWTELTCWWGPDSGWGTMHQIWKKRAILNSFFFLKFLSSLCHSKKVRKNIDFSLWGKKYKVFIQYYIFCEKLFQTIFFLNTYKWHFFQILEHCVGGAHLHSGPPAAAGNNFFICWAQMGFPDTWPNWFGSHAVCFTWKKMDLTIIPDILEPC